MSVINEVKSWLNNKEGKDFFRLYVKDIKSHKIKSSDVDYNNFFFRSIGAISWCLSILGVIAAVFIYLTTGDIFKSIAVVFLLVWMVVFLRYFVWALYHYNVNYGITIQDWEKIEDAKKRLLNGEDVLPSEIEEPSHNPFRSQTFGLPPGTVRGMIAFSLLFGAITLLIASMGMTQVELENSLIRDQFEFFKTAFLMMIAFYFGDKSLKYLQQRWHKPGTANKGSGNNNGAASNNEEQQNNDIPEEAISDDAIFQAQDKAFETEDEKSKEKAKSTATVMKDALSLSLQTNEVDFPIERIKSQQQRIPIIDAGHGGLDENGNYTTKNAKQYKFTGTDQGDLEIFEGVINRKIARKLIEKLEAKNMSYCDLNSTDGNDMPLRRRVNKANALYDKNKSYYYLSIHSNSASANLSGSGTSAHGFEIFTSRGTTTSDLFAKIAAQAYKSHLCGDGKFRFRGVKEANFYVLKHTNCPAILVENLFFDNYEEAKYLLSDEGQDAIAECLCEAIENIT